MSRRTPLPWILAALLALPALAYAAGFQSDPVRTDRQGAVEEAPAHQPLLKTWLSATDSQRRPMPQSSSGPGASVEDDDGDAADAPVQSTLRLPAPFEQPSSTAVEPLSSRAYHVRPDEPTAVIDGLTAATDSRGPPPHVLPSL